MMTMMPKKLTHFHVFTTISDHFVFTEHCCLNLSCLYPLVILLFSFHLRTPDKNVPLT